jgi:hypothetical protein
MNVVKFIYFYIFSSIISGLEGCDKAFDHFIKMEVFIYLLYENVHHSLQVCWRQEELLYICALCKFLCYLSGSFSLFSIFKFLWV